MKTKPKAHAKPAPAFVLLRVPAESWETLRETLEMDSRSRAFDSSLRAEIADALDEVETIDPKPAPTAGRWLDCGEGALNHPVTGAAVTTRVVEAEGWGRIFEVYDYSGESAGHFALILAAPELLALLEGITRAPVFNLPHKVSAYAVSDETMTRARALVASLVDPETYVARQRAKEGGR